MTMGMTPAGWMAHLQFKHTWQLYTSLSECPDAVKEHQNGTPSLLS